MNSITAQELKEYRLLLSDYPDNTALDGLNAVEQCQGNLEDALALLVNQSGTRQLLQIELDNLAQMCRNAVCSQPTEDFIGLLNIVSGFLPPPASLAVPVALYIIKLGVRNYCQISNPGSK
ncbi:hypothetical protein [Calothrix sp. PCC 6303]|uniref:hypothetical protein n=1 Tax=Calothrix sp. PCC 6303 TaxID=1170562 RepID=UPI0002A047EA|nr:hypothetical protein [Calothrix sp. PCC 6303]AFY99989.1 hypothetical protein Cal6303_0925 [Calothrix sp. PCC 6303]